MVDCLTFSNASSHLCCVSYFLWKPLSDYSDMNWFLEVFHKIQTISIKCAIAVNLFETIFHPEIILNQLKVEKRYRKSNQCDVIFSRQIFKEIQIYFKWLESIGFFFSNFFLFHFQSIQNELKSKKFIQNRVDWFGTFFDTGMKFSLKIKQKKTVETICMYWLSNWKFTPNLNPK